MRTLEDFVIPFVSTLVAELGDKSQISLFLLAAKTKHHGRLLLGAFLAFAVVDGAAVIAGASVLSVVPFAVVRTASAALFLALGAWYLLKKGEEEKGPVRLVSPLYSGFVVTFAAELGDKTQVASGLLATKFAPLAVFAGVLAALLLLSYLSIRLGKAAHRRIDRARLGKISGLVFIAIGVLFLLSG